MQRSPGLCVRSCGGQRPTTHLQLAPPPSRTPAPAQRQHRTVLVTGPPALPHRQGRSYSGAWGLGDDYPVGQLTKLTSFTGSCCSCRKPASVSKSGALWEAVEFRVQEHGQPGSRRDSLGKCR